MFDVSVMFTQVYDAMMDKFERLSIITFIISKSTTCTLIA